MKKIQNIRHNYNLNQLRSKDLKKSPIDQFKAWFSELGFKSDFNAFTLSTYSKINGVQSRIVLLKDIQKDGFIFYTNYNSLKAKQMNLNNNVALCFFWPEFQRQVRVNGLAYKLSNKVSNTYFKQRPRRSQIAAWVSKQSDIVTSRELLEKKFHEFEEKFRKKDVLKPNYWGGYKIKPLSMEFWQGRVDRMHDRFLYTKINNQWTINRLSP